MPAGELACTRFFCSPHRHVSPFRVYFSETSETNALDKHTVRMYIYFKLQI